MQPAAAPYSSAQAGNEEHNEVCFLCGRWWEERGRCFHLPPYYEYDHKVWIQQDGGNQHPREVEQSHLENPFPLLAACCNCTIPAAAAATTAQEHQPMQLQPMSPPVPEEEHGMHGPVSSAFAIINRAA